MRQEPVRCQSKRVFIAVRNKRFKNEDTDEIKPDAFYLRKKNDAVELGISVIVADRCPTMEEAKSLTGLQSIYGIDSLLVAEVEALGLQVIQDSATHASIIGMPYRTGKTLEIDVLADELADKLARLCRIEHR